MEEVAKIAMDIHHPKQKNHPKQLENIQERRLEEFSEIATNKYFSQTLTRL